MRAVRLASEHNPLCANCLQQDKLRLVRAVRPPNACNPLSDTCSHRAKSRLVRAVRLANVRWKVLAKRGPESKRTSISFNLWNLVINIQLDGRESPVTRKRVTLRSWESRHPLHTCRNTSDVPLSHFKCSITSLATSAGKCSHGDPITACNNMNNTTQSHYIDLRLVAPQDVPQNFIPVRAVKSTRTTPPAPTLLVLDRESVGTNKADSLSSGYHEKSKILRKPYLHKGCP